MIDNDNNIINIILKCLNYLKEMKTYKLLRLFLNLSCNKKNTQRLS